MGGYRPSIPAYNQTQMMTQRAQAIEHINQLTRLQSRGHRQKQCGTPGRPPSLLDLLWQVAKHELTTNPFWQQEISPEDIPGMVRDWAQKAWDARDFDPTNPRDWVDPLGLYRVPKMVTNKWDRMSSSRQMYLMQLVLSVGISMLPVVGDIYDAASAIVGRDLITGDELAGWEKALALAPFVGVAVWKLAAVLADSGRIAGKAMDVARAAGRLDELGDVARAAGHLDEAGDIARAAGRLDELGDVARATGRADEAGDIARTAGRMDVADELAQVGRHADLPSSGQWDDVGKWLDDAPGDAADAARRLGAEEVARGIPGPEGSNQFVMLRDAPAQVSREWILKELRRGTPHSRHIADLIEQGEIGINILGENLFAYKHRQVYGHHPYSIDRGFRPPGSNQIYLREAKLSPYDMPVKVVHEATHVSDRVNTGVERELLAFVREAEFARCRGLPSEALDIWFEGGRSALEKAIKKVYGFQGRGSVTEHC